MATRQLHPWRDGVLLAALIADVHVLVNLTWVIGRGGDVSSWHAIDLDNLYQLATTSMVAGAAFRFSPAIAQLFLPFTILPWLAAIVVFLAIQLAATIAVARWRWPFVVLFPPALLELWVGNVDLLMAMAIVAGFRWPATWSFLLLTKVTPGIGVLWFAFRGEWRRFAIAVGSTVAISAVSFAIAPHLWFQWVDALQAMTRLPQSDVAPPLVARLPVAVLVVALAARTDRRWLLPVGCMIAMPNPWWNTFAILAASIVLAPEPLAGWISRRPRLPDWARLARADPAGS